MSSRFSTSRRLHPATSTGSDRTVAQPGISGVSGTATRSARPGAPGHTQTSPSFSVIGRRGSTVDGADPGEHGPGWSLQIPW
ncbi:hypothetical protein [Amycolatopsis methanolica]|uniref:hypothetical protein n=1 Tax=Amycolatopsis methanolica TaxID=1814 RepID=UPI00035CB2E1|nr:hypothetical protein [Amycolatopsis methanolica]